jgi:catechol-2,3-dioxygenase
MSRIQLALDVTDLEAAVAFYSSLFSNAPAKRKPGYANFEIVDPPLKLVLIEGPHGGTLNHLGVETTRVEDVVEAETRLTQQGVATTGVEDSVCCYAAKTETWVTDPDGAKWEWYVKRADAAEMSGDAGAGEATCCSPDQR